MIRAVGSNHNSQVRRDTLIDFFRDLVAIRGEFLVYDDGYRRRVHTYEEVGRAARGLRGQAERGRAAQGRQGRLLGREPARVDRLLLGLPDRRRHRRSHRLSIVAGLLVRKCAGLVRRARASSSATTSRRVPRTWTSVARRGGASRIWTGARTARCLTWRSRATTSSRSSSRPAPPPSRRASSSATATCWRTSCRSKREVDEVPALRDGRSIRFAS